MLAREQVLSTYLGSGIAIPHGELDDLKSIYHTGVSVLQLPDGVEWEPGERAYLVIGLAATSDEHVGMLANLASAPGPRSHPTTRPHDRSDDDR